MTLDQTIARAMELTQAMHDLAMVASSGDHIRTLIHDLTGVVDQQAVLLADRGNVVPFND